MIFYFCTSVDREYKILFWFIIPRKMNIIVIIKMYQHSKQFHTVFPAVNQWANFLFHGWIWPVNYHRGFWTCSLHLSKKLFIFYMAKPSRWFVIVTCFSMIGLVSFLQFAIFGRLTSKSIPLNTGWYFTTMER